MYAEEAIENGFNFYITIYKIYINLYFYILSKYFFSLIYLK